ncbi:YodL domain-containing protein [Bengtsoniella intestinalis]|uniref:YodL domain-containing protein n=1 Tax=Bengtsoniella intestinalis TaxID=3073143 RepID=UPI00391F5B0C
MAEKLTQKERLKEITDSIETEITSLFASDKYAQYLRTMSRFHRYSVNNTMLIAMQNPEATVVAGFNKWRDSFHRNVKKGEKGIKIIAPTPYKIKEQQEKIDPVTKAPLLDANGQVQTEEVEKQIPMFRVVSVFDVSQTEGEPLPTLSSDLTGNVAHFSAFMDAVERTSPVPIFMESMPSDTDGFFNATTQRIAVRDDMSEVQTVSATIHEVAHAMLHSKDDGKNRRTEEVEAESISYAVCSYYGIETAENSLGYIANWSQGKELKELRASLETINKTASAIITGIDSHFREIVKERGIDVPTEQEEPEVDSVAFELENGSFLAIFSVEEGNDYSFFDKDYNLIDGGVHDDPEWTVFDVARDLLAEGDVPPFADLSKLKRVDYDELTEKTELVEMSKIVQFMMYSKIAPPVIAMAPDFEDRQMPLYSNREGERFVFGYGHLGNGTTVWNYLDETDGDYTTVAHISEVGELTYHKDFEVRLPLTAKEALSQQAEQVRKEQVAAHPVEAVLAVGDTHIAIKNQQSTWRVADETTKDGAQYFLLESELYGEKGTKLIVDAKGAVVLDGVWKGFHELNAYLRMTPEEQRARREDIVPFVTDDDLRGKIAYDGYEIAVEGHLGTWYVVDATAINGTDYFLLEHEEHGGDAACIIVDVEGKVVLDDVWNGFDDLEYFLESQTVELPVQAPENPPYQLPDPTVSVADAHTYGYTAEELLPMEKARALELFGEGFAIYALHPDNTEAMIFEEEEIAAHEGLFGIEKEDWTAHLELEVMKDYNRSVDHSPVAEAEPATYTIYQLSKDEANHYHRFTSLETLEREGLTVRKEGYDEIYSAPIANPSDSDTKILNQLYDQFNINHPVDFKGHSLSVSDIIALQRGSVVSYHYVDSYGFTELPNYLQTAELSTEQNYNMVDGQINNLPTVEQLEHDASHGKPVSLMELLDATKREQQQNPTPKKKRHPRRMQKGRYDMKFTVEETNLMCIYTADTRNELMANLSEMQGHLQEDETELKELTASVLTKLESMTDEEFEAVKGELVGDFE